METLINTSSRRVLAFLVLLLGMVAFATAQDGRIEFVDGDVWILRNTAEFLADFGDDVFPADQVRTGSDGVAVIRINDRSQVKLREDSIITIGDVDGQGEVELHQGGLFARVAKAAGATGRAFSVRTPTVVAGVRGTEFFVAYGRTIEDAPDLWLCVNEGSVEVAIFSSGESTLVREGEGVNVLAGDRITDPKFYPWTQDLNWNFNADSGSVRDETDLDGAYSDLLDQDYD